MEPIKYKPLYLGYEEMDNAKWKSLLLEYLKKSTRFEIHCWNEEIEWINFALQYGSLNESDWQYGKIITGSVTTKFFEMLLKMPKPSDIEIYNKMTPFFNVFLDNGFQSSHYGTEIYLPY